MKIGGTEYSNVHQLLWICARGPVVMYIKAGSWMVAGHYPKITAPVCATLLLCELFCSYVSKTVPA